MKLGFGLTGEVKATVLNSGVVTYESPWTRNLWLDDGLDRVADIPICDAFSVAIKGTGDDPTTVDLSATANTFSVASNASVLTRTAGTFVFSADDVGALIRFTTTPFQEFTIIGFTDTVTVEISPSNGATAISNKKIKIFHVERQMQEEVGRTNTYGNAANDNTTTTSTNTRTFKRAFLFPQEDAIVEFVTGSYSQSGTTVTRTAGSRNFTIADVGATIKFLTNSATAIVTAYVDASHVTVSSSATNSAQSISITSTNSDLRETPDVSNTYSRAGAVVTRATGTRDFTADDVGKVIHFNTSNLEAKITIYTNATTVTVDDTGTLAAQTIRIYGFTDYPEVGFSHTMESGDTANIRVVLSSPVRLYGSTALRASDQLKLTYQCRLTVSPSTATTGSLNSIINDPANEMSSNKNGKFTIESFATSTVASNGETNVSFADLEPFYSGYVGLSVTGTLTEDALAPLTNKVRDGSTLYVPLVADAYAPGSFLKTYQGVFGLNDGIGLNWRSLMIYDPDSKCAIFTFLYDRAQKKDGDHTFQIGFQKSWGRDLS